MTKSEAHSYMKYNAHLDKDSYVKPTTTPKFDEPKPTLASCGGKLGVFKKKIREWYKRRANAGSN